MDKIRKQFKDYSLTSLLQASLLLAVASILAFYSFYDKVNFKSVVGGFGYVIWATVLSYMFFGFAVYSTLLVDRFINLKRISSK